MGRYTNQTIKIEPKEVVALLQQGVSTTRIAYQLGCGRNSVYNLAREGGWEFPPDRNPDMKRGYKKKCVCCGTRYVPEHAINGTRLYLLCSDCYKNGESRRERDDND